MITAVEYEDDGGCVVSGPGPLWRRAPLRLLRSGTWALLVLSALTLLVAATAAPPLFASASDDAAIRSAIEAVPDGASAADAPLVRVNGGATPTEPKQAALLRALAAVPGLSVGVPTGGSVGVELVAPWSTFRPFVSFHGAQVRARIYGQDDLAAQLVPAPGSPAVAAAGAGVWLPEPVAHQLGVRPGDQVTVGIVHDLGTSSVRSRVAGAYQVAADGRRPADPSGGHSWLQRNGLLPRDSELVTNQAYLLLADVPTAQRLADAVGDHLFWTVEAHLDPAVPTLAQARRTADGVVDLQRELLDPTRVDIQSGPLRPTVLSGLPQIIARAESMTDATMSRTRTLAWAGTALGLVTVLAVGVLAAARRRQETTHATGSGLRAVTLGAQAAMETLPAALLAVVLGTATSVAVVARWGPPAPRTTADVRSAMLAGAAAAVAGVLTIAVVTTVAATLAARRSSVRRGAVLARTVPWEAALAVAAVTAVLSLMTRPGGARDLGPLDLLVPLLVVAAVGAVGGRLLLDLFARLASRAAVDRRATQGRPRSPALWLAARRLAAPGPERILVVTVLAAGLGMLLYSISATAAVQLTTDDRVAVLSGATATADVQGSWVLDRTAPTAPKPVDPGWTVPVPRSLLKPVADPILPAGDTVVWHRTAIVPSQAGQVDLLVVDPETFAAAASWGRGPELAHARALLPELARKGNDAATLIRSGDSSVVVPAILVGGPDTVGMAATATSPGLAASENAAISGDTWTIAVRMLATVPAFPGHTGASAMLVLPSDAFFTRLGGLDPRYRPRPGASPADTQFTSSLWSARGVAGIDAVLAPLGVDAVVTTTQDQVRTSPAFVAAGRSLGYLFALGLGVAAVAVVALGLFADRAVSRSRPGDVMLARVGLGRRGTRRARLLEMALLTSTAALAAVSGVLLATRLGSLGMDPGATTAPAFRLRVGAGGYATVLAAALVALGVAASVTAARTAARTDGTVLRDAT